MGNQLTVFERLPEDLIADIFLCLDVANIVRLKKVCKLFKTVISRPWFRLLLANQTNDVCFVHRRDWFADAGELIGYGLQGDVKFMFDLRNLAPPQLMNTEMPQLLAASGNLFVFVLYPAMDTLLVLNPFNQTIKRVHWPFEITPVTFINPSEFKIIVSDPFELHFRLVYVEFHYTQPVHFTYDSVTRRWWRRVARMVMDPHHLNRADDRALFLKANLAYMISFTDVDSYDPLYMNPPPIFYESAHDSEVPYMNTPEWADDFISYFLYKWLVIVNDARNINAPGVTAVKSVTFFRISNDWTRYRYVVQLPPHLLEHMQDHDPVVFMSFAVHEYAGVLHIFVLKSVNGSHRVYRYAYDTDQGTWTEATHVGFEIEGVIGLSFIPQLFLEP